MPEILSADAVRVLGVLVEKSMSTPEYYPLTLNSLRMACNQKSNRAPVVSFTETDVVIALDELLSAHLAGHVSGGGSRAMKYRHAVAEAWQLSSAQCATIACLSLRGAQTIGEIKGRTGRLFQFDSLIDVESALNSLIDRTIPLAKQLPRSPGQKEVRYVHMLSGDLDPAESADASHAFGETSSAQESVENNEIADLRMELARLREEFEAFKQQFE